MLALRNLRRNKLRNFLTMVGVAAGIAVYAALTLVSHGLKADVEEIVRKYDIDITVQSQGAPSLLGSSISREQYAALKGLEGCEMVAGLVMGPIKTYWNPYLLIFGISSSEAFAGRIGMLEGGPLRPGRKEILVGDQLAHSLGYRPGGKILLGDREYYSIRGIFAGDKKFMANSIVFDIDDARRLLHRPEGVNLAFIRARKGTNPTRLAERINRELRGLTALPSGEFMGQVQLIRTVNAVAWTVSIIALLTSCIVVMNTFFMAISERTREIGILMAVGWSRARVMASLMTEAALLCLAGGAVGFGLGMLELHAFSTLNPEGVGWWLAGWLTAGWSPLIFFQSLAIALGIGLFGAVYPAWRATGLWPAEALRHE